MWRLLSLSFMLISGFLANKKALGSDSINHSDIELDLPKLQQGPDKTNCGPSAAAIILAAYHAGDAPALRDLIGEWSWDKFTFRRLFGGGTSLEMLKASLNHFSNYVTFDTDDHPWIPREAWAVISLKANLQQHKPLVVLVDAKAFWGLPKATGLHWIVVRGYKKGMVSFNDSADNSTGKISISQFWDSWRIKKWSFWTPGFLALIPSKGL